MSGGQDLRDPAQVLRTVGVLWAALTFSPLAVAGAFHLVVSSREGAAPFPVLVAYGAIGLAVLSSVAMVALPSIVVPARSQAHPGGVLVTRTILGAAIGESGALLSCVAYFLTGEVAALFGVAVFVATSLSRRPTRDTLDAIEREQQRTRC